MSISVLIADDHQIVRQGLKVLLEREGFEVLTLAPALADYANRNQVFLHGSGETKGRGHWNETGHRVVGELIAEKVCELIGH